MSVCLDLVECTSIDIFVSVMIAKHSHELRYLFDDGLSPFPPSGGHHYYWSTINIQILIKTDHCITSIYCLLKLSLEKEEVDYLAMGLCSNRKNIISIVVKLMICLY